MSQDLMDSLEEEMAAWKEDMCHQNVNDYLPKILTRLEESTFIQDGINVLQLICKSFLPVVPTEELEDKIFSHICKMMCSLLTGAVNKIHLNVNGPLKDTAQELKETIAECLQWVTVVVESIERCVRQTLEVNGSLALSSVQSLPVCAVTVLRHAYAHCKESSDLYGELLDDVGESLSSLFKKAHSLQSALLALLDKITVPHFFEESVQVLCTVCSGLFEVCKVVNSLDIKLVVSLWKSISRICSQNLAALRDRLEVCPLVSYLCQEIVSGYAYLFQLCPASDPDSLSQGDDKAFNKWVKIVGFQMKVLVALLRDFSDYLGYCEKDVVSLLLSLHRSLPPCLGAGRISEAQEGDMRSQIVSATLPILNHLIGNRAFRTHLTVISEDLKPEDYLPMLLLQLMVLDLLPKCQGDVMDYWLQPADHNREHPSKPLVSVIFDSVRLCFLEMRVPVMMPGLMVAGKPLRPVSLYEHVVVHLCGFIGSCLGRHFPVLEQTLLENVVGGDQLCGLLATDAWCFMARYGSASLCDGHVQHLIQLYLKMSRRKHKGCRKSLHNLTQLIKRLVKFLSPPQQVALEEQNPPLDNLDLWLTLTLTPFCEQVQHKVGRVLVEHAVGVLGGGEAKLSTLRKALNCVHQVVSDQSLRDTCFTGPQIASVKASVCGLWASFAKPTLTTAVGMDSGRGKEMLVVEVLEVTSDLADVMTPMDVLQVIDILHAHLEGRQTSGEFAQASGHFIGILLPLLLMFSDDTQSCLVSKLAPNLRCLLTHRDYVVQSTALSCLASVTSNPGHQNFLSLVCAEDTALDQRLHNFLNKVPCGASNFNLQDFLRHQQRGRAGADSDGDGVVSKPRQRQAGEDECIGVTSVDHSKDCVEANDNAVVISSSPPTSVLEGRKEGCEEEGNPDVNQPPAKRNKLSPPRQSQDPKNHVTQQAQEGGQPSSSQPSDPWQSILDDLNKTAADIEKGCSNASPPEWFTAAASVSLARINECLAASASWFDSLL